MAPQTGALNQQIWAALEDLTREWAKDAGSAYIITGGFFYDPAEEDPNTADGLIDYSTIGKGAVAVPTHFYKIVVKGKGDQARAIGFVAENRGYKKPFDFAALIKPIDWIEERAGLNFMPDLTDAEEAALEKNASPMF
jgi:DNA/RNA endonuclease G (NUC1)